MKKKLLALFTALVATSSAMSLSAQNPEAYAVLSNFTLTLHYDNQRNTYQDATTFAIPLQTSQSVRVGWEYNELIKKVIIEPSLKEFMPYSTAYWFVGLSGLDSIQGLQYLNTKNVTDMKFMFTFCKSLKELDVSNFNTENVTDMHEMFADCEQLKSLDLSNFATDNVTTMYDMFGDCMNLETLQLSRFNTENVTDMGFMFSNCKNLKSLDVSRFNTSKVTAMNWMFAQCTSLETLDLANFNTALVGDMDRMFKDCSQLKTIYCNDDWSKGVVTASTDMFIGCNQLKGAVDYNEAMVDVQMANPVKGYFTSKEPTAISDITTAQAQGTATRTYNLNGQPVGDGYKGIVIKGGKKMLQK